MGFRINTNIAAMNAHRNAQQTNMGLDKSLQSLSSGLRINKAADDASGMTIADSLRSQANGLGQAIKNANDGVSVVQTADGALDEYIKIVDRVRTLSIQAASDGQNADSRAAIQRDVDRLLEGAQNIVDSTSFNGLKLLNGEFTDKKFQVGAYANETVNISIGNAGTGSVGKLAQSTTVDDAGTNLNTLASADITADTALVNGEWAGATDSTNATTGVRINGYNVSGNLTGQGSEQLSAKGMAAAINFMGSDTGVTATAETSWAMTNAVSAGTIGSGDLVINGVNIGSVTTAVNDTDGALMTAINDQKSLTGVIASVDSQGILTLAAADGRNIQVTNTSGTDGSTYLNGGTTVANASYVTLTGNADDGGDQDIVVDGYKISAMDLSGDAAADADVVIAALQAAQTAGNISANYTFTDNAAEGVTLTRTDGKDINIRLDTDAAGGGETALIATSGTAADGTGGTDQANGLVYNASEHGNVTMSSRGNISIQGDASTLATFGLTDKSASASGGIDDADVTTFGAAQTTIQRADSALLALDAIRSDIGSVQNQLESTIRNISVTQVNVTAAESQIRDVDFAAESANFAKLNILAQSGSYAMSQANAVQQNVMRLLQ